MGDLGTPYNLLEVLPSQIYVPVRRKPVPVPVRAVAEAANEMGRNNAILRFLVIFSRPSHLNVDPSVRNNPQQNLAQLGVQQVDIVDIKDAPVGLGQQSWHEHSLALSARKPAQKKRTGPH